MRDKSIPHNLFRKQDDDSIFCGFYYTAFIEFMLADFQFIFTEWLLKKWQNNI